MDLITETKRPNLSYDEVAAICKELRMHKQNGDDTLEMLALYARTGARGAPACH